MNREAGRKILDLALRVLDGGEIEWKHELEQTPGEAEILHGLHEIERLADAHWRATLVTSSGGRFAAEPSATPGRWGTLRLLERIGEGSYGEVFRAYDPRLQLEIALKLFRPTLRSTTESLLAEARSLARVRHPNVLQVYGADEHEGRVGMWSELLRGRTLEDLLDRQGPFSTREATGIGIELCRALAAVHGAGLVHGDIKTSNVMREHGGRIVLTDFGTATPHEHQGTATGTPITAAPELLQGALTTPSSDLYALGVLLYRLVAGAYPVEAGSIEALREAHRVGSAVPVRDRRADLSARFVQTVERVTSARPEDRYRSAGELERALTASLAEEAGVPGRVDDRGPGPFSPQAVSPPPSATRSGWSMLRRWSIAAASTIALAGVIASVVLLLPRARTQPPHKKDWILVADFDGPPEDSSLALATRELVSAALDQSQIVASVPRDQINLALERAGRPVSARVDAELARELAYRSSVRAVIEGRVNRLGRGYSVVLRVVDADSARLILTESAVAKNEDALISTLGRLVSRLRTDLGENRNAIRASLPMEAAATPSFEAYRLFVRAFYMEFSMMHREAIPVLREALALDPDFAVAWWAIAAAFANTGQGDSARVAVDLALRRPQRLTTVQRLTIEAGRVWDAGDAHSALAAYDRALQHDPTYIGALINSAVALYYLGRFEESLERIRTSEHLGPYGPTQLHRYSEARDLIALGRFDEAGRVVQFLEGPTGRWMRLRIEIADNRWASAESSAAALLDDPGLDGESRAYALTLLASAQAAQGDVKAAAAMLQRAVQVAPHHQAVRRARLMLTEVSGGTVPLPTETWAHDSSATSLITRGLRATIAGDRGEAQRLLSAALACPARERTFQQAAIVLLKARIESLSGRWANAPRILVPMVSPARTGFIDVPSSSSAARWFLADVYEELGRPDSAAACLDLITTDPGPGVEESHLRGIVLPFAHRRLVNLYARMGRVADAQRHLAVLERWWASPDPDARRMLEEARSAVGAARSMARPRAQRT